MSPLSRNHRWTEEDEIIVLDLYFRVGLQNDSHVEVCAARNIINPNMAGMALKLSNICYLNHLDKNAGALGISMQLRRVWAEYCYDNQWMLWKLKNAPDADFAAACKDLRRLNQDARRIIKSRTPRQKVARREARQTAMRVLYAALIQHIDAAAALTLLQQNQTSARDKTVFMDDLLKTIVTVATERGVEIEQHMMDAAGRSPTRISDVERAIIHSAIAELLSNSTATRGVIINEAVEIAKQFGAEGGYKIVNGTLDKIAKQI